MSFEGPLIPMTPLPILISKSSLHAIQVAGRERSAHRVRTPICRDGSQVGDIRSAVRTTLKRLHSVAQLPHAIKFCKQSVRPGRTAPTESADCIPGSCNVVEQGDLVDRRTTIVRSVLQVALGVHITHRVLEGITAIAVDGLAARPSREVLPAERVAMLVDSTRLTTDHDIV